MMRVVYFYENNNNRGPVTGLISDITVHEGMSIMELKGRWPIICKKARTKIENVTLKSIEIRFEGEDM